MPPGSWPTPFFWYAPDRARPRLLLSFTPCRLTGRAYASAGSWACCLGLRFLMAVARLLGNDGGSLAASLVLVAGAGCSCHA
jgi:hypothetical protein